MDGGIPSLPHPALTTHIRTPSALLVVLELAVALPPALEARDKRLLRFGVAGMPFLEEDQDQDYQQHEDAGPCYEDDHGDCAGGFVVSLEEEIRWHGGYVVCVCVRHGCKEFVVES